MPTIFEHITEARALAASFNARAGSTILTVNDTAEDPLHVSEVRGLAHKAPGSYYTPQVFQAIRGRLPTHVESVKAGQLLASLSLASKRHGGKRHWQLDSTIAARAD